jgi:arylsulfatase A
LAELILNTQKGMPMNQFRWILLGVLLTINATRAAEPTKPNVLVILADDLGYGDVQCYNPERGKIPTPAIDNLAKQGMRFTDAHTSSGVCSPTRYTLLTGRYHWRTRLQSGIVSVWEQPLIAPDRLTIAGLLKLQGYQTMAIGKWHLGWDWPIDASRRASFQAKAGAKLPTPATAQMIADWKQVFSQPIAGGPTTRGFDGYFGTDVPNWPPYCFIENDRTVGMPSELLPAEKFKGPLASQPGPALPGWQLEQILPTLTDRAVTYIQTAATKKRPFFLYMPLTAPHTPIAVNQAWQGKSGLNAYADFVMETDAAVGRVLKALDDAGVAQETLVIFTSDNGCSPLANFPELQKAGHYPSGPWRGKKADAWEGGHRVPMIVRWPRKVAANVRRANPSS